MMSYLSVGITCIGEFLICINGNLLKHYNIIVAVWISLGCVTFAGYASCINAVLKECFYRTDVDYLCDEYNVNFSLSLSVINHSVYSKFGNICGVF